MFNVTDHFAKSDAEKICKYCGISKSVSEFYMAGKNRRECQCKSCRENRRITLRERDPSKFKADHAEAVRRSRVKNRKHEVARYIASNAIRSGKLIRQPCQICGEKAEAHHPDYDAPLSVVWLCKKHHHEAHMAAR